MGWAGLAELLPLLLAMRRLQLVKGARVKPRADREAQGNEQRFRFPPEQVWEVSYDERRKPALPRRAARG